MTNKALKGFCSGLNLSVKTHHISSVWKLDSAGCTLIMYWTEQLPVEWKQREKKKSDSCLVWKWNKNDHIIICACFLIWEDVISFAILYQSVSLPVYVFRMPCYPSRAELRIFLLMSMSRWNELLQSGSSSLSFQMFWLTTELSKVHNHFQLPSSRVHLKPALTVLARI